MCAQWLLYCGSVFLSPFWPWLTGVLILVYVWSIYANISNAYLLVCKFGFFFVVCCVVFCFIIGMRGVVVVIVWLLDLQLPVQSVPIPLKLWVRIPLYGDGVLDTILYNKVCQWFAAFGFPHLKNWPPQYNEILLKVALNTMTSIITLSLKCYII